MNDKNTVNITISLTPSERKALKQAALDMDISVSALIRSWIKEHQEIKNTEIEKLRHS